MTEGTQNNDNASTVQASAEQGTIATDKPKLGAPSKFTAELGDELCNRISDGRSLRSVCAEDDMPDKATVYRWMRIHETFRDQYARACEDRADAMAEDMLDIADDGTNDYMTITKGDTSYEVVNNEAIQRSRLRVDTRKWHMSKMRPKKYGDRLDLTSGGEKLDRGMSDAELNAILSRERGATDQAGESTQA